MEWTGIITLISVLGGKVAQSATALMAAQTRYAGAMAKEIQQKSDNSQVGMLMHLMESMEDQECKEMILSYCVLSANGKSMTLKEIDTKCEMLLHKRFGLSVDFDVEGAVVKLLREGLVEGSARACCTRRRPCARRCSGWTPSGTTCSRTRTTAARRYGPA